MIKVNYVKIIKIALICYLLLFPVTTATAAELKLNLPPIPPSIEELTGGKVKIGDLITKDNVELVREYLTPGLYENVKRGMVLRMANKIVPPEKRNPRYFLEATERNKGRAVVDDNIVVRLKDGSPWPGGIPFTEPKNAKEVMGYVRFCHVYDDGYETITMWYVNKYGKCYKTSTFKMYQVKLQGRLLLPPFGTVPGLEDKFAKYILVFTSPYEIKGLGQLTTNFVDDTDNYDIGFAYLPAFKRTIRVSATTYQDNMGGSDVTYGDPQGLREPFGSWNFKLLGKKYMLVTEFLREKKPIVKPDGTVDPQMEFDEGKKYPRLGWAINPVYVVEATPKDRRHIYRKKIIYVNAPYFASSIAEEVSLCDSYDRAGELWKFYMEFNGGRFIDSKGQFYTHVLGFAMYDLQTGHTTLTFDGFENVAFGIDPNSLNTKRLLQLGR